MIRVQGVQCVDCGDIIYSRNQFDNRKCSCENTMIEGTKDYLKVGYKDPKKLPKFVCKYVDTDKKKLYKDWACGTYEYGIIRSRRKK